MSEINSPPKLRFQKGGNAKLDKTTTTFSLPAGYTCPGAKQCKSRANVDTGRITDGPHCEFRCFAATAEAMYGNVRASRWHNNTLLRACKTPKQIAELILFSMAKNTVKVRVHESGDFFNQMYFDGWVLVAKERPDILFYAYTKSLPFWVARKEEIPENFVLTASYGGVYDDMIEQHGLRHAVVVFHPDEAEARGLEIDHDDHMAYSKGNDSFALLIHGTQPKDSEASQAIKRLKKENIKFSYGPSQNVPVGSN